MKRYWLISQYLFKKIIFSLKNKYPKISKLYINQYPSVQLNHKMDNWDYGINFSSEIVIGTIVLVIAVINLIIFNPLKAEYNHTDGSLASTLLKYHPNLNVALANRQNTISTKVVSEGIFAQASASENQVLGDSTEIAFNAETQIDDSGITKPNPDSIQSLINNQVKIIKTKPFDTVYTIAEEYGLKPQTIRDSNGLPNYALLADWDIIVPPVDGIVIQVTNPNLTLTDVADTYKADIKKIVSYNALEDEEDMVAIGGYLIIPDGTLTKPEAPAAATSTPTSTTPTKVKPSIPKLASIAGNHKFAPGYCTDYVARNVAGVTWGGNANRWIPNAKAQGVKVDRNPVPGAILVTNENRRYGHVAKIDAVNGSQVTISEWNYAGLYKKTVRTLDISDKRIQGVIHP
jgi:surface antigen